jgi:hypothetical protein
MNRTARHITKYCVEVYKLIIFLHSKRYRPSSMLSHRQNSRALRGRRCTGRGEAQSRELVNTFKTVPVSVYQELYTRVKCKVFVGCVC